MADDIGPQKNVIQRPAEVLHTSAAAPTRCPRHFMSDDIGAGGTERANRQSSNGTRTLRDTAARVGKVFPRYDDEYPERMTWISAARVIHGLARGRRSAVIVQRSLLCPTFFPFHPTTPFQRPAQRRGAEVIPLPVRPNSLTKSDVAALRALIPELTAGSRYAGGCDDAGDVWAIISGGNGETFQAYLLTRGGTKLKP